MKKYVVAGIATSILVICLVFSCYTLITDYVIAMSVSQMKVQAEHDEASLELSLNRCWTQLEGAGRFLQEETYHDAQALQNELLGLKSMLECRDLYLVDASGRSVVGVPGQSEGDEILALCNEIAGPFVFQVRNPDSREANLYIGNEIGPVHAGQETYNRMVMTMPISYLLEQIDLDSYGGSGYSCIIDMDGEYVVSSARDVTDISDDDFFKFLSVMQMEPDWDIAQIKQEMAAQETFYIDTSWTQGKFVTAFIPMQEANWYYILAVPYSYFQSQGSQLLSLLFLLLTAFVILAVLFIAAFSYQKMKTIRIEEKANKSKSLFLNNMSHDIRTPMNAVMGYTTLAQAHLDDKEKVADYLDKIGQSSKHLLALINDVLGMARMEAGKVDIKESAVNLEEMAHGLEDMVIADVRAKNLCFVTDVDVREKEVLCDRLHLDQVMLNMLSNAIKYTPADGKVCLSIVQKSGDLYTFTVQDTGIGMSPEFVNKIFEPFAREKTSTVSGIQGTGLGMTITKNLVNLMGGTIHVDSEEEKGTTITVSLHLEPAGSANRTETAKPVSLEGMQILLVEDNAFNREIAVEILSDAGCLVHTAENGQIAVDKVRQNEGYYDLILMDVQMPVMDGYAATRQIRIFDKKTFIVALSANVFEEDQAKAVQAGMDAYISKPVNVNALIEALKKFKK